MRNYRGKRIDNGEWVYGWYCKLEEKHFIIIDDSTDEFTDISRISLAEYAGFIEVHLKTIGQQVGLKDKHGKGKECYKDDLMQLTHISFADCCLTKIVWDDKGKWVLEYEGRILCSLYDGIYVHNGEIIGNIHTENQNGKEEKSD